MSIEETGKALGKTPETVTLLSYVLVLSIATFGGLVSFLNKTKKRSPRTWSLFEAITATATSAFAGLLTLYVCKERGVSLDMTAALAGMSGFMGSRALHLFETFLTKYFPPEDDNDDHDGK